MHTIATFVLGLVFALGLGFTGLSSPDVIIGFLDIGAWDASLLVAFAVASTTYGIAFRSIQRLAPQPVFGACYRLPGKRRIDSPLITGAAIFGVGWGLAGICPGSAIASLATLRTDVMVFAAAMVGGFVLSERVVLSRAVTQQVA